MEGWVNNKPLLEGLMIPLQGGLIITLDSQGGGLPPCTSRSIHQTIQTCSGCALSLRHIQPIFSDHTRPEHGCEIISTFLG